MGVMRVVVVTLPNRCFLLVVTLHLRHRIINLPLIRLARSVFMKIVVSHHCGFVFIEWHATYEATWGDLHGLMHSCQLLCLTTTVKNTVTILFH